MKNHNLVTALNIAAGVIEPPPEKEPPKAARNKKSAEHEIGLKGVAHRKYPKTPRNDPCPCGSGRKYKKCCGAKP